MTNFGVNNSRIFSVLEIRLNGLLYKLFCKNQESSTGKRCVHENRVTLLCFLVVSFHKKSFVVQRLWVAIKGTIVNILYYYYYYFYFPVVGNKYFLTGSMCLSSPKTLCFILLQLVSIFDQRFAVPFIVCENYLCPVLWPCV